MKHRNSHLLVGYWSRLRKGRAVPNQADIDPRALKRMLSSVFILDVENAARPIYRLAGTALCERFGFELKGTGFLAHWEAQSTQALSSLLRQSLTLKQPICLSSIGASADCGMVELETTLCPIAFNGGMPTRFVGLIQILSDQSRLLGKPIAFQRLAGSQLIREDDPLPSFDSMTPPPPPPSGGLRINTAAKAPHLRLVVSHPRPVTVHFVDEGARAVIETLGKDLNKLTLF